MAGSLLKILAIALSLGLDVFAVSVGVGMRGTNRMVKVRIGAAFATAEIAMTLIGVAIGGAAGKLLGDTAGYLGFAALIGVGIYMTYEALKGGGESGGFDLSRGWGLFLGALSISLDSLGIGFSINYIGVPLALSIVIIGVVSVLSTTIGLALGRVIGAAMERAAGIFAGVILIITGAVFAALKAYHVG